PKPDPGDTPVVKLTVDAPVLSHRGGVVRGPVEVTIRCNTPAAEIHYTLDDSPPTTDSPLYAGAITVAPGKTLRARAFRQGWEKSALVEAEYTRDTVELTTVVAIRGEAKVAWEKVKLLERGQGFAVKLDQGAKLFSQASDLYKKAAYGASKAPYSDLVKLCAELTEMQAHRQKALDAQSVAKSARGRTAEASSNRVRANLRSVDDNINRAEQAYEKGKFDQSIKHASDAEKLADAELSSILSKNIQAFEAKMKEYKPEERAKIEKFGGQSWAQATTAIKTAKSARTAEERVAACKACEKAIAGLPGTADAAFKAARTAASDASNASKAAEIKKRFAAARKLLGEGLLRKALAEISALEKLTGRNNKDVSNLKSEVEKKLRFSMPMSTDESRRFPKLELAWIPAGEFEMGSPTTEKGRSISEAQHPVEITKPFYMGVVEINRQQYQLFQQDRNRDEIETQTKRFARVKGREPNNNEKNQIRDYVKKAQNKLRKQSTVRGWDGKRWARISGAWWDKPGYNSNHGSPVTCISWAEATQFCVWLSKESGRSVRLPTEAEWEYACRAGGKTAYSFGDEVEKLHKHGNYADKSSKLPGSDQEHDDRQETPGQVGRYSENPWKLKDMHGSVAEWCSDRWGVYRPAAAATDPRGPTSGSKRVVRGGSWYSAPKACRSAARYAITPVTRDTATGFRVVVEIEN
ncbi:MAG: SUMF1/EgtB/PvdO family nonheme iron enzyme, partial [Phycisphaerales bacterium]|nr:SUMF1/EgtB/PvdO family nonheme iron enzyme [Phycisphaerales bacterium]